MRLYISAQDIQSIAIAIVRDQTLLYEKELFVQPEEYLGAIESVLKEWGILLDDLDSVGVVTGPGSFTASRVSTTIANTIAYAKQIPIVGIENEEKKPLRELFVDALESETEGMVLPTYDRPPHITQPKKLK
jgi:hypothetical protein